MSLIRSRDGRRGAALVEFALIVPLLVLLFVATAEIVLYMRIWFRLERTAAEVANVGSQLDSLAPADLADPLLLTESREALDELTQILDLGGDFYPFQRTA